MLLISHSCDLVKLQYVSRWASGGWTPLLPLPTFASLPLFFKYTSLSQSVSLNCPCPSASICPASHFGKHNLFWLSVVLDSSLMLCVFVRVFLGKRHHKQSSHGTLYEPLDCVMFVYLACLPPHRFVRACVCVWSGSLCWPRCSTELMDMHTG